MTRELKCNDKARLLLNEQAVTARLQENKARADGRKEHDMSAFKARLYEPDPPKPDPPDLREVIYRAAKGEVPRDVITRAMKGYGDLGINTKGGLLIPDELLRRGQRTLNMTVGAEGAYLKAQEFQKEIFGTLYRSVREQVGIVELPAKGVTYRAGIETPMVAEVVPEGEDLAEAEAVFNSVSVSLKNVGASGVITRNALVSTGRFAAEVVQSEMDQAFDLKKDELVLNEILDAAPVPEYTPVGALTFADAIAMKKTALDGGADLARCFWIGATDVGELLEGREKGSAGNPGYIVENGKLANAPFIATPAMPAGSLIFGDFANGVVLFDLGILDLVVAPITPSGNVRFVAWRYLDAKVGRGKRLVKVTGVV